MSTLPVHTEPRLRPLGFSTGCLYRMMDPYSPQALDLIASHGHEAIEIMCARADHVQRLTAMVAQAGKFYRKSVHLPLHCRYGYNTATLDMLNRINDFYQAIDATLAVLHYDLVDDWEVISTSRMNIAVENLDCRHNGAEEIDKLRHIFDNCMNPGTSLVLDLNHCFTHGDVAARSQELIRAFGDRIEEVHLSGSDANNYHFPLHRSRQSLIIDCLPQTMCPIIIESPFDRSYELRAELDYIQHCQMCWREKKDQSRRIFS